MGTQLEFMDCPTCGKRVATTARVCRHCGVSPTSEGNVSELRTSKDGLERFDSSNNEEAHLAEGGYDALGDDFDYDEFIENEFGRAKISQHRSKVKPWVWYTTWLLIVVLTLPILVQLVVLL